MVELTIPTLLALAAADSVNPCELAVLILALVAILTQDPRNRKKVLLTGLSFTAAIFIMYLVYGLFLVEAFNTISSIGAIKIWIYRIIGALGIILGIANIKDYFIYGGLGFKTEVPGKWRPSMKNIISKIESPAGGFIAGLLVAFFLTPCTMGPYVICCGLLGNLGLLASVPWLLLYNFVFVLPMIAITLVIYLGFTTVESVSGWREKNLRLLHLISGIILIIVGTLLVFGII
ncbi:hypothetical protein J4465_02985 [Candidatus Pacearchaeota archaeon]|nr:hypothetical protein [Candidatus Pacearchaeota archaeon]